MNRKIKFKPMIPFYTTLIGKISMTSQETERSSEEASGITRSCAISIYVPGN
jgi:hypothetical protein